MELSEGFPPTLPALGCFRPARGTFFPEKTRQERNDPVEAWDAERMLAREMLLSVKGGRPATNLDSRYEVA